MTRQPAPSSLPPAPGLLSARPALPSSAGVAGGFGPMEISVPLPPSACFLPFSVLSFFWFIRPWGKPGPVRLPAEKPLWPGEHSRLASPWGRAAQPSALRPAAPVWRIALSQHGSHSGSLASKASFRLEDSGMCRIQSPPSSLLWERGNGGPEPEVPGGPGPRSLAPTSTQLPVFSFSRGKSRDLGS